MTILSTTLKWEGRKEKTITVSFDGYDYTVTESFGIVTLKTEGMKFDEATREYYRIIRAYFWDVEM